MGDVIAAHREASVDIGAHHFSPQRLAQLVEMIAEGKLW